MRKKQVKKSLKRILALQLALVLGISAAGCGREQQAGKIQNGTVSGGTEAADGSVTAGESGENGQNDGSSAAMGRYVEQSAEVPASGGVAPSMALLADGQLAYYDGNTGLYTAQIDELFPEAAAEPLTGEGAGESTGEEAAEGTAEVWQLSRQLPDPGEAYISHSSIAEDGSLALIAMDFKEEDFKVQLQVTDTAGEPYTVDGKFSDGDYIIRMFWREPGQLYGVSVRGRVCQVDYQQEKLDQLFVGASSPETLAFREDQLFAVENEGVEIFDLSRMELQESDPVLDEFCRVQFGGMLGAISGSVGAVLMPVKEGTSGEENVLYLACRGGLYRHIQGGAAMEELLNGQLSVLGNQMNGLCNMEALSDGTFILLHTGGKVVRMVYDPNEPAFPDQQLNIYSLYENDRVRQAVQMYSQQNTDVYVNYEVGITDGTGITLTDAQKSLNLELLGENGPDVVILDGLDADSYLEKGMFLDLTAFVEALPEENGLFTNLIEACKTDGKLYEIPAGFQMPVMFGKQEDLKNVENLASLADCVENLRMQNAAGSITGSFHAGQELAQLLSLSGDSFLQDGQLDKAALTKFLQQAKRIVDANMSGIDPAYTELFGQRQIASNVGNKVAMMMTDLGQIGYGMMYSASVDAGHMDVLLKQGGYEMKQWSWDGKKGFLPANRMAVSAAAAHREAAEDFLELMLSPEMQNMDFFDGFPVNTAAFDELCRERKEGDPDYYCMGASFRLPDGTDKQYSSEWPRAEVMEQVREMAEQLDFCIRKNVWLEEVILEHGPNAMLGTMDIDETVETIARSIGIYLAE